MAEGHTKYDKFENQPVNSARRVKPSACVALARLCTKTGARSLICLQILFVQQCVFAQGAHCTMRFTLR